MDCTRDFLHPVSRAIHMISTASLSGAIVLNYFSDGELNSKMKEHDNYSLF